MRLNLKTSKCRSGRNIQSLVGCALVLLNVSGFVAMASPSPSPFYGASAQAAAPATNRFLGTITAVGTGVLTVKTDAGVEHKVTVPEGVRIQRIAPGAKDLSSAATIQFSDLAVGDRVLVRLAPEPTTDPVTAISIVAIPQADLAQKQQQEREDWQKNGVGGLVKSVNAGTGEIVIVSGAGPTQKTIALHTSPTTILRRYAANSVDYNQAKPGPLETIQAGDQLRARGTKNADGTELTAVEVVSGSFRNISGVISSINAGAATITLKDLLTKQNVTVHIGADTQMRKLPETMARVLSSMTNPAAANGTAGGQGGGGAAASAPAPGQGSGPGTGAAASAPGGQPRNFGGGAPGGNGGGTAGGGQAGGTRPGYNGQGGDTAGGRRGGDLQQMLSRAPAIHLSDLQKGDAVMLVSTEGTSEVTAVTLLAGVEPLLQAPASTQNMLLSNWSMSSGSAEAAQ